VLATSVTSGETGVNLDLSDVLVSLLADNEEIPGRHNALLAAVVGCE